MKLKPMDIGELLDQAFRLYKDNFKTYITISALSIVPSLLMLVFAYLGYLVFGESDFFYIAFGIIILLGIIPAIIVTLASFGASIKVVSEQVLDRKMNYKAAYKFGFKKAWPIFAASFLMVIAVFIGTLFLIIPGILFYVWFSLYSQAIIVENLGALKALSRSKGLIKGAWWRTFGILIVMFIIIGFLGNIITLPAQFVLPLFLGEDFATLVNYLLSIGISMLITPLSHIAATLLYYDLRIRKEGYDIQVMTENLHQAPENTVVE